MAAASVTMFWPFGTTAGFFSIGARHSSLNVKKDMHYHKLSSMAGVNSVILPAKAMGIGRAARCIIVSKLQTQTLSTGTLKKVSSHNGFNWPICASRLGSGGNEPEEPGEEPTEESCDHHTHEDVDDAPDSITEKLSLDQFKKLKLRIYKEYVEDHLSVGVAFDKALDQADLEKEIKDMLELEELLRKTSNAEGLLPDLFDLFVAGLLMLGVSASTFAIITGALVDPLANLLTFLLPAIRAVFRNVIIQEIRKFNP